MGIFELIVIAVGLALDAFAVAMCNGLKMKKINYKNAIIISLFFGLFQAFMPLIGWILGNQFEEFITDYDHYVAFFLLFVIGLKMIVDSFKKEEEDMEILVKINYGELIVMSIATSIDALAIGITLACLKETIVLPVILIGVITFALSFIGVLIGNKFGLRMKNKAELFGGIVLILIGTKILLEHLGVI